MILCCQILLFFWIFRIFLEFFVFAPCHKSHHTHPHRYLSICTHACHFLHTLLKHHVRGNFPGHSVKIMVCRFIFCMCLPSFCVPPCPHDPAHPFAPIYIRKILNCNVYMYNLIENCYQNYIKFEIFHIRN